GRGRGRSGGTSPCRSCACRSGGNPSGEPPVRCLGEPGDVSPRSYWETVTADSTAGPNRGQAGAGGLVGPGKRRGATAGGGRGCGMSEREAFIAAAAAEREEDLPRLAFADWLDENGETGRARFIRLQCWLAQRERSYPTFEDRFSDPLFEKLYQRARDLLDAYEEDWFGKFSRAVGVVPTAPVSEQPRRTWLDRLLRRPPQPLGATRVRGSFTGGSAEFKIWGDAAATSFYLTRGFVDALSLSMSRPKPPPSFPLAFRLEPVSRMWIDIAPSMVGWHAIDGPHLMRLKNLGLAPPNEARRKSVAVFEAILGGSHWTGLQSLTLYCPTGEQLRIPPAYLTTLARTSLVFTLSSLSIVTNLDGLVILAASSNLSRLRSLTAWGCELPSGTGGVLADAPFWEHLEHLDLSSNHLG